MVKQKVSECLWGCWSEKLNSNYPSESLLNGNWRFLQTLAFLEEKKKKTFHLKIRQSKRNILILEKRKEYDFSFYTKPFLGRLLRKDKSSAEIEETKTAYLTSVFYTNFKSTWLKTTMKEKIKNKKKGWVFALWNNLVKHHHQHWSVPSPLWPCKILDYQK